jgi:hypothetical protein
MTEQHFAAQVRKQLVDAQGALAALREQHLADARDANAKLRADIEALQLLNRELDRRLGGEQKRVSMAKDRWLEAEEGRRTAETQLAAVRALHERDDSNPLGPWCGTCLCSWPCGTIRTLDGPAEQPERYPDGPS